MELNDIVSYRKFVIVVTSRFHFVTAYRSDNLVSCDTAEIIYMIKIVIPCRCSRAGMLFSVGTQTIYNYFNLMRVPLPLRMTSCT